MTATMTDVQTLIDACPTGGTVTLPSEVHLDATSGPFVVPRSMTIQGPSTITVTLPTSPASTVVEVTAPNGSTVAFRGFTVDGPTGPPPAEDVTVLRWWLPRSQDSTMIVDDVTITGLIPNPVSRSGGGRLIVTDCDLSAWEEAIAFFANHGEPPGELIVSDSVLRTGTTTKPSSIGIYVHPHMHTTVTRCHFEGWSRYGVYWNGSPVPDDPLHVIAGCTFTDCDLMQSASGARPVVSDCVVSRSVPDGPGATIRGSADLIRCQFSGFTSLNFAGYQPGAQARMIDCVFTPSGYAIGFDGDANSRYTMTGCRAILHPGGRLFTTAKTARCVIDLGDLIVCQDAPTDSQRRWWAQVQGQVAVLWDDAVVSTPVPRDAWVHGEHSVGAVFLGEPTVMA